MRNRVLILIGLGLGLTFTNSCDEGSNPRDAATSSVESGATEVAVTEAIQITFRAPIDTSTVTPSSLFLVEENASPSINALHKAAIDNTICNPDLALDTTTVCISTTVSTVCSITPDGNLPPGTSCILCATSDIAFQDEDESPFEGLQITFTTAELESLAVTPVTPTQAVDDTQQFIVTGTFTNDSTETLTSNLSWQSSNTAVATISSTGLATAVAAGTTTITASEGTSNISGTATLTVTEVVPETSTVTIGGTVSGLSGTLVLKNNGGDNKTITTDGSFTFATAINSGDAYAVTVLSDPSTQTCVATSASGTANSNITGVTITCTTNTYTVGGTLSGLSSGTLVLQNNSGNDKSLTANGSFTFSTAINDGGAYSITVLTQPAGQICTLSGDSGTVSGANITTVSVSCVSAAKHLFLSASTSTGNLKGTFPNGIVGADAECMADANYPGSGTYKALIVDGTNRIACTTGDCSGGASEHTDWVLAASTDYILLDDSALFTTNSSGIFVFTGGHTWTTQVTGTAFTKAWTGLTSDWKLSSFGTCSEWTATFSSGGNGDADQVDGTAIGDSASCGTPNIHLYCVEQ